MTDLPTYDDVLAMLTKKARSGSVSAMIALERALRPGEPEDDRDEVGEAIDRILARKEPEGNDER